MIMYFLKIYKNVLEGGCGKNLEDTKLLCRKITDIQNKKLKPLFDKIDNLVNTVTEKVVEKLKTFKSNYGDIVGLVHKSTAEILEYIEENLKENFIIHDYKFNKTRMRVKEVKNKLDNVTHQQISHLETYYKKIAQIPQDCQEVLENGSNISGVYMIRPTSESPSFRVWCDMNTEGGGWTYILNRFDGSVNFYENFSYYRHGFGKLKGEHWLGLTSLYHLTDSKAHELLVELSDWNDATAYARYNIFEIGTQQEGFKIKTLGKYNGTAGDSLAKHFGMKFSTSDNDQDKSVRNCAAKFRSGWWYNACYKVLLTGEYMKGNNANVYAKGIHWNKFRGYGNSLKTAKMMIRPTSAWSSPALYYSGEVRLVL